MIGSVLSNGFQFIVSGSQPKALNDFQIINLQVFSSTRLFWFYIVRSGTDPMLLLVLFLFFFLFGRHSSEKPKAP